MVSIIVACYNQGKYISETLDSVIQQTYTDFECIVINDGSNDNTEEIVQAYKINDKRIKYIYQENQGVCVARNRAINEADGEYILCLDADDKISNNYLKLCVNELDNDNSLTLVTCNYQYFGNSNKVVYVEDYSIEKLMGHNLFINCSMFRRKDFDAVNGFNLNMKDGLEDWDFWLSILKTNGKVKCLNGVHFFYRIKKKSRNNTTALTKYSLLRKQIWENHIELYSKVYMSPTNTLEYIQLYNSKEYKLGCLLLKPLRWIKQLL